MNFLTDKIRPIYFKYLDRRLLTLFGAEETLLPLALDYMLPIKLVVPSFLPAQLLSAFLRNDGEPELATKAVLFGGVFNVFGILPRLSCCRSTFSRHIISRR